MSHLNTGLLVWLAGHSGKAVNRANHHCPRDKNSANRWHRHATLHNANVAVECGLPVSNARSSNL